MIRPYSRQKNFFLNVFRFNKESEMNTQTVSTIISHYVKEHLQDIPTSVVDISLVGSFSGIYGWKDTRFGDADISIICSDLQNQGFWNWLNNFLQQIEILLLADSNIEKKLTIEKRAIDGPYKPAVATLPESLLLIHVLLDKPETFVENRGLLIANTWKKYPSLIGNSFLHDICQFHPSFHDLLFDNRGVIVGIDTLVQAHATLTFREYNLQTGQSFQTIIPEESFVFYEYLMHKVLTISRDIARCMRAQNADCLTNREFATWFFYVTHDDFPIKVVDIKEQIEKSGYEISTSNPLKNSTLQWLLQVKRSIESHYYQNLSWDVPY